MGSRSKQMRSQDEMEFIDRRRSDRIIALEEKKQQERDRKLALALEKKNNLVKHHDMKNKEKGKAKMELFDDLSDSDYEGPTMKGRNNNKISSSGKPKKVQQRTSQSAKLSPNPRVLEMNKRDMYWPPSKSLVAEVLNCSKPNIQFKENPSLYRESLSRFVENLGPTAQRVAFKKLEALQTPKKPATLDDSWHSFAAALLATSFSTVDKEKSHGISVGESNRLATKSSNNVITRVYPTRVISGPQLNPSELSLESQSRARNSMSVTSLGNSSSNIHIGNSHGISMGEANMLPTKGSNNVFIRVHPTRVVSGPQQNLSELSLVSEPRSINPMTTLLNSSFSSVDKGKSHVTFAGGEPNMLASEPSNNVFSRVYPTRVISGPPPNLSELSSIVSQQRPKSSMYDMASSNLIMPPPMHQNQPWPVDSIYSFNPLRPSAPLSQQNQRVSIPSHEQFMHQATPYAPPVITQGFPIMQMQALDQLNSHGPLNYYAAGGAFIGQQNEHVPQFFWNNDL